MKIIIKQKIGFQDTLQWIAVFCVVSFAMVEHMSIPIPEISSIKMPLVLVGGLCVIPQLKLFLVNVFKKRYFAIFLILLTLCGFLLFAMKYNSDTVSGYSPERNTIRLVLYLLELFILMIVFAERGQSRSVISLVFGYVLLIVILTDVFMFTRLVTFGTERLPYYLVGSKFSVVYRHFDLLVLWCIRQADKNRDTTANKLVLWAAALTVMLVAIYVDCMTGVLGSVLLVLLILRQRASRKIKKLLAAPSFFILCILVCTLIAFVIGFILDIPFVTNLIEDVLRRDTTLTGRIKIYQNYIDVMGGHWLFGYGFGSGNVVSMQHFGCANAQNAMLHWVLQSGWIVSTLLIAFFAQVVKRVNDARKEMGKTIELLLALIYTYVILGIVETTYSMSFILFMALLLMTANDKKVTTS